MLRNAQHKPTIPGPCISQKPLPLNDPTSLDSRLAKDFIMAPCKLAVRIAKHGIAPDTMLVSFYLRGNAQVSHACYGMVSLCGFLLMYGNEI